jgi:hypothetical protein
MTRRDIDDDRDATWNSPGFYRQSIEVIALSAQLSHTSSVIEHRPADGALEELPMSRISTLGRFFLSKSLIAGSFALTPNMQAQQRFRRPATGA